MIELQHAIPAPNELSDYRRSHPGALWDDAGFYAVRVAVRRQLNQEQDGLCVYCEGSLAEDDGHVEHIRSRHKHPALVFVYDNLAHSCDSHAHCGHLKGDRELPVEPRPGCNRSFTLSALDGRLGPALGLSTGEILAVDDTVAVLGLNDPGLAWQRKGWADALRALSDATDIAAFISTAPFRWSLRGL